MQHTMWIVAAAIAAALGYSLWRAKRRWLERERAAEQRLASFAAQALPGKAPLLQPGGLAAPAPHEQLLFDAADKAGEAGEPVLSIQLYARLLARYPETTLAGQARAAVQLQKQKLAKP